MISADMINKFIVVINQNSDEDLMLNNDDISYYSQLHNNSIAYVGRLQLGAVFLFCPNVDNANIKLLRLLRILCVFRENSLDFDTKV